MRSLWSCLTLLVLPAGPILGAEVSRLKQQGASTIYGTDAFSISVHNSGRLNDLKVGETVLFPLIALYTTPITFDTGKGLRVVQGESPPGGLSPRPPQVSQELKNGSARLEFRGDIAHQKIHDARPLCQFTETILIRPEGRVDLHWNFRWTDMVVWSNMTLQVLVKEEAVLGKRFWWTDGVYPRVGRFEDIASYARLPNGRGRPQEVWCDTSAGVLKILSRTNADMRITRWKPLAFPLGFSPGKVGYHQPMFPGVEDSLDLSLILPLPGGSGGAQT